MKAIVQYEYGPPDVLKLEEIEVPAVKDDEVLVRVRAASVHPGDWYLTQGMPYLVRLFGTGFLKPKTRPRGTDWAGTVEAVGKGVTQFRPGGEVFGCCNGALAEFVCAREKALAPKPRNLTFEQAATVPTSALTALQGLRDQAKVKPGQRVLIFAASGGVGSFAVQIAKSLGATVTGVCSTQNVELVRSIGADEVIDYTRENFADGGARFEIMLDIYGNPPLSDCKRALTPSGILVAIGGTGGRWIGPLSRLLKARLWSPFARRRVRQFIAKTKAEDLLALKNLIEAGKVTPVIEGTYSLSETSEAVAHIGEGHTRGKVAITIE